MPGLLVAEDNPADVALLRQALAEHGVTCDLQVIDDGEQALNVLTTLNKSVEPALPNAMILDLNLPKISGLEILRFVKSRPLLNKVKVAILTSSLSERDRKSAEALGADLYLTKPIELRAFLDLGFHLKKLLNH